MNGAMTKIITIGIGIDISIWQLKHLASGPGSSILLPPAGNMTHPPRGPPPGEQQLLNAVFGKISLTEWEFGRAHSFSKCKATPTL